MHFSTSFILAVAVICPVLAAPLDPRRIESSEVETFRQQLVDTLDAKKQLETGVPLSADDKEEIEEAVTELFDEIEDKVDGVNFDSTQTGEELDSQAYDIAKNFESQEIDDDVWEELEDLKETIGEVGRKAAKGTRSLKARGTVPSLEEIEELYNKLSPEEKEQAEALIAEFAKDFEAEGKA